MSFPFSQKTAFIWHGWMSLACVHASQDNKFGIVHLFGCLALWQKRSWQESIWFECKNMIINLRSVSEPTQGILLNAIKSSTGIYL